MHRNRLLHRFNSLKFFSPVLQFAYEPEQKSLQNDKSLRKHKYNQREMSFLYSLLDVTPTVRYMFLTHPLVSAFLHMKANATSKKLRWLQMLLVNLNLKSKPILCFHSLNRLLYKDKDLFLIYNKFTGSVSNFLHALYVLPVL